MHQDINILVSCPAYFFLCSGCGKRSCTTPIVILNSHILGIQNKLLLELYQTFFPTQNTRKCSLGIRLMLYSKYSGFTVTSVVYVYICSSPRAWAYVKIPSGRGKNCYIYYFHNSDHTNRYSSQITPTVRDTSSYPWLHSVFLMVGLIALECLWW